MVFLIFSLGLYAFSRAYIYFKNFDDILSFKERFDNYVFLDSKSNEYPAVVEFAQYQRRYKNNSDNFQKKDSKCNTIEQDSDYIKFLENFDKPSGDTLPSCEANLEELEQKERDKLANGLTGSDATFAAPKVITPLLEYMRKKREEKKMLLKEVCCFLKLIKQMKSFIYLFCYLQRDRDLKKRREEERRNNKRYDNRDRDRERERERDYGYSGASSSKNFNGSNSQRSHKSNKEPLPSTSNIDPSNVKILTKSSQTKNPSNNDSNKSSASSSNHHNTESKAGSFGSKSSNDSNNNSNNKDMSNKHSSAKSNYNSYKNNNSGHNSSRNSNKESNYNEFSNDGASSSYTNNENKKSNTDQNNSNSNQQQNKKEGYDSKDASKPGVVKNKDRPSIEIYNPAARRQQKQQPPAK